MRFPAVPVFLVLLLGALAGLLAPAGSLPWLAAAGVAAWQVAIVALVGARALLFVTAALASLALSAAAAAHHADWQRRHAPIRAIAPSAHAPPGAVDPVIIEGRLMEDAAPGPEATVLRVRVDHVRWGAARVGLAGGVVLSVGGAPDPQRARAWTRGRRIRAPALLRRPSRYLNDGVADAERASLRRGVALVGTVKSAALVDVIGEAGWLTEALSRLRARVRASIARASAGDPETAAVTTAILIGDRAGLAPAIERRMQRAGTYHVIAISGGNVALFATLAWGAARLTLRSRRAALLAAMLIVGAYGASVGAGASVGRAVAAAELFLLAALIDQRAPPLNVIAAAGVIFLMWDPLALTDLGFLLSFGATAGILLAAPPWVARARTAAARIGVRPALAVTAVAGCGLLAATAAAEIALLPIQAAAFHRVTLAGLFLNFIAIPAMAVVQVAGMAIVALDALGWRAPEPAAAMAASLGARALIDSPALVDAVPALTWRVAAPPAWLHAAYVIAFGLIAWQRWPRARHALAVTGAAAALAIAFSLPARAMNRGVLRLTLFDVGQAEAMLVRLPSGRSLLVDAAGPSDRFDIADRVLVPALLARGAVRLDLLAITHADLDHIGGAAAVVADLRPARVIEGITPALNRERNQIARMMAAASGSMEALRAGSSLTRDGVLFRVLHPPPPEWERQRVRNDDSLVFEVVFGRVSILLTGDAGEAVEPSFAAQLSPARLRILKVAHHGSRTSTSPALLEASRPVAALISAGRGNVYGHPSAAVIARLRAARVETFRTDRHGQIDLTTDGRVVEIATHTGKRWRIAAR